MSPNPSATNVKFLSADLSCHDNFGSSGIRAGRLLASMQALYQQSLKLKAGAPPIVSRQPGTALFFGFSDRRRPPAPAPRRDHHGGLAKCAARDPATAGQTAVSARCSPGHQE